MKRAIVLTSVLLFSFFELIHAQDDIIVGSLPRETTTAGALYDYSNPSGVNFKIQLWGYVRLPGYYIVPAGTSLDELISLAGGPREEASLDDIRVVKLKEDSQTTMIKYNYNDLVWEDKISDQINYVPLNAGDIVVIPGEPRYFVREDIAFYLGIVSTLASLTALIISIIILTE